MSTSLPPNGPDTKEGYNFVYVNIPLLVLCAAIVSFRVWWRCVKNGRGALNRADICVVICLVFNIIQVACITTAELKWGFGHHARYLSAEQRYNSLLYFFVFQCFVKNTVAITKLSFLFLYLDIFPQKKFRIICWVLIAQIGAGLIALSATTIFQCTPVRYSWDKTIPGKCINIKAFWYGQSGWNTLMDVVVLLLPIPLILRLQMNRRAKLSLALVFGLGLFVCVTSIERLISLNFNATFAKDFTWATGTSVIWTQVESTVGVICACVPSLRIPLARFFPYLFGSTTHDHSYPLSDSVSRNAVLRSNNWKEIPASLKKQEELDMEAHDDASPYTTGAANTSEEGIIGIKKTVSVDLTYVERPGEKLFDGKKVYEKHHFDRHAV